MNVRPGSLAFVRFAWGVVTLNVAVILWGAYVRATGSGAGCGSHWPLCNGQVLPVDPAAATRIEFIHRLMSGVALLAVVALWLWARRRYAVGSPVRRWSAASLALILVEALIGAGLVLFGWVADDASIGRAVSVPLHLGVTFALLAALGLAAWHAAGPRPVEPTATTPRARRALLLGGMVLVGMTGALTALGDTLFPPNSLAGGLAQDFQTGAHFMVRLRVVHPLLALAVALSVFRWAGHRLSPATGRAGAFGLRLLRWLMVAQTAAGVVNVLLLAPVWMQLLHLLLADLGWLALVINLAAETPAQTSLSKISR